MTILFVCTGNAHRSPLAEALLKKMRPDIDTDSAGMQVAIPVSKEAKEYLTRENAEEFLKKVPEDLHSKKLDKYDLIIVMEKRHKDYVLSKCPSCKDKIVVWNIKDPYYLPREQAERVYKQIKEKVEELADSLR